MLYTNIVFKIENLLVKLLLWNLYVIVIAFSSFSSGSSGNLFLISFNVSFNVSANIAFNSKSS